jgi:uncharacterized protein YfcZ (UPF0381/DUF406 family)
VAVTQGPGPPEASGCISAADVGRLHHNVDDNIWYECVFDKRRAVFTWTMLPPQETDHG